MSFRKRLALATAAAVAVAVLLAAAISYVAVRANLYGEIDDSLQGRADLITRLPFVADRTLQITPGSLPEIPAPELGGVAGYVQVVGADGTVWRPSGATIALPISDETRAVATGADDSFLSTATVSGIKVRILTTPVFQDSALQLARPLTETDSTLRNLAFILIGVAAGGICLAAVLGALVARTAMTPLRRLREATHHVISTHDLSRRIEPTGNDELGRLAGDFNEMMDTLEESERAQRQLVADASHELRTPLTSLRTNIEVMGKNTLPAGEQAALLSDVESQLQELTILVGDLVDLARGAERDATHEDVRLDLLVSDAVERARRHAPQVSFATEVEPSVVEGSPDRLDRAVANMLDNAAKWSRDGQEIAVTVRGGSVVVRDHGPGIPEADLPFVFDRFYRAPSARGLPGSGLGLAIVRQVAESHGGSVSARNAPDGGAELRLTLLDTS